MADFVVNGEALCEDGRWRECRIVCATSHMRLSGLAGRSPRYVPVARPVGGWQWASFFPRRDVHGGRDTLQPGRDDRTLVLVDPRDGESVTIRVPSARERDAVLLWWRAACAAAAEAGDGTVS
jgi:hypothetical protein